MEIDALKRIHGAFMLLSVLYSQLLRGQFNIDDATWRSAFAACWQGWVTHFAQFSYVAQEDDGTPQALLRRFRASQAHAADFAQALSFAVNAEPSDPGGPTADQMQETLLDLIESFPASDIFPGAAVPLTAADEDELDPVRGILGGIVYGLRAGAGMLNELRRIRIG